MLERDLQLRSSLVSNFSLLLSTIAMVTALNFPAQAQLIVAAASDLAPAQAELTQSFQKVTGEKIRFTSGSSGMLARQIANGAPYDVFLSANQQYVRELESAGHVVKDSVRVYGSGRIGLWSANGQVRRLADLTKGNVRHIAIANPQHAPYGVAARQILERAGLWTQLQPKIVYGENVRQALQFAESGNADAVLTAMSLLMGRGEMLPENLHDPVTQSGGVVTASKQKALARRFLEYLVSPEGVAILRKYGLR